MQHQLSSAYFSVRRGCLPFLALAAGLALTGCAGSSSYTGTAQTNGTNGTIGPNTLNVADAALAGGDAPMALSVSQSILTQDPNNVDALVHEGDAYYALGRCPASEAAYTQALKYDPKSAAAEIGLGRCQLKYDPVKAELSFSAAAVDDPGNASAFSNLGIARDLQGNFAGAASAYQQSLAIDAGNTATSVNYGLSLALSGQGQEALQYLGPIATGQGATPKIREDYAVALIAVGRNDDARQVLAIDLPSDKVNQDMSAFQELIASNIANPAPPPPPPPTAAQVPTAPVAVTPLPQASAAPLAAPVASPVPPPPVAAAAPPPPVTIAAPPPPAVVQAAPPAPAPKPAPASAAKSATAAPPASAPRPAQVAAVSPAPMPPPAAAPDVSSSSGGGAAVQIAALNSSAAAQSEWQKVSAMSPSLFAGKSPEISKVEVGGATYYRLRVTGFANSSDAAQFCSELTAAGGPCMPANF